MGLLDIIKGLFAPSSPSPPDARRLDGSSEGALSQSLKRLPAGERGWITLAEATSALR